MEIIESFIKPNINVSKYFSTKNLCFLDIETTGLSRKNSQIYLIGFVYFNNDAKNWSLKQVFIDHIDKEKQLLHYANRFSRNFDLLITYNGESFDLPFIEKRSSINKLTSKILDINSFDIYREIRNEKSYLNLDNLRLKTIEESLSIYREDEYSGKDCINFYYQYMNNRESKLKEKILKHNYDDLYYLLDVMRIFDKIRDSKTILINESEESFKVEIEEILIDEDMLEISCKTSLRKASMKFLSYEEGFSIDWKSENNLIVKIEIKEGLITPTKKCIFIDRRILPTTSDLKDLTPYKTPDNIILLKVEDKYILKNIKSIINILVAYTLSI